MDIQGTFSGSITPDNKVTIVLTGTSVANGNPGGTGTGGNTGGSPGGTGSGPGGSTGGTGGPQAGDQQWAREKFNFTLNGKTSRTFSYTVPLDPALAPAGNGHITFDDQNSGQPIGAVVTVNGVEKLRLENMSMTNQTLNYSIGVPSDGIGAVDRGGHIAITVSNEGDLPADIHYENSPPGLG